MIVIPVKAGIQHAVSFLASCFHSPVGWGLLHYFSWLIHLLVSQVVFFRLFDSGESIVFRG